eukprot:8290897-Alexandrium_andersonii.AAC.1
MPSHRHWTSQAPCSGAAVGATAGALRGLRPDEMVGRGQPGGYPHQGRQRRAHRPPYAVRQPVLGRRPSGMCSATRRIRLGP